MKYILIFGLIFTEKMICIDFHDFDPYQYKLTKEDVEGKINSYLEGGSAVSEFYKLTPEALSIGDFSQQQVDYVLNLAKNPELVNRTKVRTENGLNKVRVALDPGHFGGVFSEIEDRFIRIPSEITKEGQSISFNEGTLTYLTAIILKSMLEAEGAVVFITRSGVARGAIEEPFFEWIAKRPELWRREESLSKLFRSYYNREDLLARAQKINDFAPDIAIIIHYNDSNPSSTPIQANYNLAFIPGAFSELKRVEDRYEFLRLIVTDDLERSLKLSKEVVSQFVRHLNVPCKEGNFDGDGTCLTHQSGVYSRNLALTRLVHCPVCYGETLIQNNENEIYNLSKDDIQIAGQSCPKRVEEVAQAYFDGIKKYFNQIAGQ